MAISYFAFAQFALMAHGLLLGVLLPIGTLGLTSASLMTYRYATEGREKRHLRRAFEFYLDPRVIESVVNQPETLGLSGDRRHLSILFSDIVGFTSRSERSNPEELVGLLNIYMTLMTDLILQGGGVVGSLMGDGIMAFWGAPVEVANPARSAVDCALKMIEELEKLRHRDARFADFDIGIGIATGEAIVGNIGGERRFAYTLIGDNVNLASRTEGLTRQFKVRILITRETLNEANGAYIAREIGLVKVKGKKQTVPIVEVVGMSDGAKDDYYARFSAVVESLHNGVSIAQARDEFTALSKERPGDHVAEMYLELLHAHKGTAKELVFEFETK
jgi:adenylate cyclase